MKALPEARLNVQRGARRGHPLDAKATDAGFELVVRVGNGEQGDHGLFGLLLVVSPSNCGLAASIAS